MTTRPESRVRQRQAEHGDVVEMIADLADHLADPGVAIVAVVAAADRQEAADIYEMDSSRTVIAIEEIEVDFVAEARLVAHRDGAVRRHFHRAAE